MYIIFEGIKYNIENFNHPGGHKLLECANSSWIESWKNA